MRSIAARSIIVVAASFWLAAGPGGLVLRQVLACRDAMAAHGHHGAHTHHMPQSGPCFCSQMVGAFDQVVSVALPPLEIPATATVPAVGSVADPSPVPLPSSPAFVPETPPPILA